MQAANVFRVRSAVRVTRAPTLEQSITADELNAALPAARFLFFRDVKRAESMKTRCAQVREREREIRGKRERDS